MSSPCSNLIPPAFIQPCLPCVALLPPSGEEWLHEIKLPGQRLIVRRDGTGVRLFAERGEDRTSLHPYLVEAVSLLPVRSCIIDGELVRHDDGKVSCEPPGEGTSEAGVLFFGFDLLEVNGFDLRGDPMEERKRALAHVLRKAPDILRFSPHFEGGGEAMLRHAGQLGFEGVLSKRRSSPYHSGRSPTWLLSRKFD